ncbi:MAG: ABC transporter permease [Clostridiales bacterium]|nr:ABC transporter permease [Clostridiales bacterium]
MAHTLRDQIAGKLEKNIEESLREELLGDGASAGANAGSVNDNSSAVGDNNSAGNSCQTPGDNSHTAGYTNPEDDDLFTFAEYDEAESERAGYTNYSYWRSTVRMFFKGKGAVFCLTIMIALIAFAIIQPYLSGQRDPYTVNTDSELFIPLRNVAPCLEYWFGTNSIGQDLWARIWAGTRTSLFIGFVVALVEAVVGITMGILWGYVRKLDFLFTEIYNVLDNIPQTIVLILISYIMTPSVGTLIFAMSLTGWIGMARFIRNQILIIRDRDYNLASRCLGTPTRRLVFKNLLPYLVSVIMLRIALAIPAAIGNEVFITYIGLGLPATTASLGQLIDDGRQVMMNAAQRYQLIFPAAVVSVITISFYIVGNAFSDAADPKNHR